MKTRKVISDGDCIGQVIKLKNFGDQEIVVQKIDKDKAYFECAILPDMQPLYLTKRTVKKALK